MAYQDILTDGTEGDNTNSSCDNSRSGHLRDYSIKTVTHLKCYFYQIDSSYL